MNKLEKVHFGLFNGEKIIHFVHLLNTNDLLNRCLYKHYIPIELRRIIDNYCGEYASIEKVFYKYLIDNNLINKLAHLQVTYISKIMDYNRFNNNEWYCKRNLYPNIECNKEFAKYLIKCKT